MKRNDERERDLTFESGRIFYDGNHTIIYVAN
jgi:hypothetical protein